MRQRCGASRPVRQNCRIALRDRACSAASYSTNVSGEIQVPTEMSESGTEAAAVDPVFPYLVADDAFGRMQEFRGLRPVAAAGLEGVENEVLLVGVDRFSERQIGDRA